jgi:hypothetical protein
VKRHIVAKTGEYARALEAATLLKNEKAERAE